MFFLDNFSDFALDVVGFLAILGEGSIQANAHIISLSYMSYVPRLLPAPQALLPAQRSTSLRVRPASVTGVSSGNMISGVNHVADVLIDVDDMEAFEVRCVNIERVNDKRPVRANPFGPMMLVTAMGCACSIGLFVTSIVLDDGMSLIATILLSFLSTLTGIGNKWSFDPLEKPREGMIPRSDLVVRYPNGSFLVVLCDEITARELFFTRRDIHFKLKRRGIYRLISLVGTMLLMFGVIFLANAQQALQIAWGGCFVTLNAAYWTVAAMPKRSHWDLDRFRVTENGVKDKLKNNESFTDALWQAILFARGAQWAKIGEAAAPRTPAWDAWLDEAETVAQSCKRALDQPKEAYTDLKWSWPFAVDFSGMLYHEPPLEVWNPRAALGGALARFRSNTSPKPEQREDSTKDTKATDDPKVQGKVSEIDRSSGITTTERTSSP